MNIMKNLFQNWKQILQKVKNFLEEAIRKKIKK
ncbi:hypothetical protein BDCR2A_01901 [Borrelia duttonii CR2A]|uniref:Uncharacterized protein n=1 Tax=Borrelia duttonii CR2A TaxID=1432657 RepID=W6TFT3_9SPIR|nr:hypothetical protein BDCR2A_01901 [Borrelia duttonii CR2A]